MVALLSTVFKISAHSAGAWGVVGFITAINFKYPDSQLFFPIIMSIVLAGAINSARLYLNEHDLNEVGWGSVLGFVISFGAIQLLT